MLFERNDHWQKKSNPLFEEHKCVQVENKTKLKKYQKQKPEIWQYDKVSTWLQRLRQNEQMAYQCALAHPFNTKHSHVQKYLTVRLLAQILHTILKQCFPFLFRISKTLLLQAFGTAQAARRSKKYQLLARQVESAWHRGSACVVVALKLHAQICLEQQKWR